MRGRSKWCAGPYFQDITDGVSASPHNSQENGRSDPRAKNRGRGSCPKASLLVSHALSQEEQEGSQPTAEVACRTRSSSARPLRAVWSSLLLSWILTDPPTCVGPEDTGLGTWDGNMSPWRCERCKIPRLHPSSFPRRATLCTNLPHRRGVSPGPQLSGRACCHLWCPFDALPGW